MRELKRVLLVDDDEDIRSVVQMTLEAIGGLAVETCASGEEALAAILTFRPDLVILDVEMPGTDGTETLEKIRSDARMSDLAVVFFTARSRDQVLGRYGSLGALDVIAKPFDALKLSEQIRSIWDQRAGDKNK